MTATADRLEYRSALARLNGASLQKTTRGLPAYTRYVNRPLGRRVAAWASLRRIHPNHLTVVGTILTFAAIVLLALARPTVAAALVVVVLLAAGYVLDSADGPLARLRGGGTPSGEWLDHVADAAKHCFLHAAVLVSWFRWFDLPAAMLLVPVGFLVAEVLFFFTAMLTDALRRQYAARTVPVAGSSPAWRSLALLPIDYGAVLLCFVLLPWRTAFVVGYTALAAAIAAYLLAVMPKWYRDVRDLERP